MPGLKRVAWFYCDLDQSGGSQRLSLEGCRVLQERGIESPFLLLRARDPSAVFDGKYRPGLVSRGRGEDAGGPAGPRLLKALKDLLHDASDALWLRRTLRRLRPDYLLTEATGGALVHAYLATLGTGIPCAVQVAGSIFALDGREERTRHAWVFRSRREEILDSMPGYRESAPRGPAGLDLPKRLWVEGHALLKVLALRHAAAVFVHSSQNAWEVGRLYGRGARVLKGAFPESIFEHGKKADIRARLGLEGRKVVLALNRLAEHKRLDLCLRAFARLRERRKDAVLLIAGRSYGSDAFQTPSSELEQLAAELGIGEHVRFLGYVPEGELWDTYLACDVFLHMDRANFDIVPYEALALGRTVVWSKEMEADAELSALGRIFPAEPEARAAAEALELALRAPCRPLGAQDRRVLSKYTWEEYFRRMLEELEKVRS